MKARRYTTEEKIRILREADQGGRSVQEVCRDRKISEQTFYRWKREFGMLEVNQAKQLKELQKEDAQLKRMLADEMLGQRASERGPRKKAVSPSHKREVAKRMVGEGRCTARAACRHFGLHRSTFSYRAKAPSPWQNGYIESFNARLRDECIEREQLWTLTEARVVLEDWRWKYNHLRPHRSLGYITPLKFAQQQEALHQPNQYRASSRPTASLRLGIDFLYNLNYNNNLFRLTNTPAQFG